jgi:hypothetical protein
MAPFNFAQRSSSRTAVHAPTVDLKVQNLDLNASSIKEASLPPAPARYGGKPPHLSGSFEPSKAFVRQLATKSEYRSETAAYAPSQLFATQWSYAVHTAFLEMLQWSAWHSGAQDCCIPGGSGADLLARARAKYETPCSQLSTARAPGEALGWRSDEQEGHAISWGAD